MKKSLALTGVLLFFLLSLKARSPFPSKEQVGMFMNSTTCVVLEKSMLPFNIEVKKAMEKSWKITDFEFIDVDEFQERRFDSKFSFIFIARVEFEDDEDNIEYNFLNLTLGDTTENMAEMPEFASLPLAYADDYSGDYSYAVPAMVRFIQKRVEDIRKKYLIMSISSMKRYNKNIKEIKSHELLVDTADLAPDARDPEVFHEAYKGVVEFTSTEHMEDVIYSDKNDVHFLHVVKPVMDTSRGRSYKLIFSPDGDLLYFNFHYIDESTPPGFLLADAKHIG